MKVDKNYIEQYIKINIERAENNIKTLKEQKQVHLDEIEKIKSKYINRERIEALQYEIKQINEHIIREDESIKTLNRLIFTIIDKD